MELTGSDKTLLKNYIRQYRFLFSEYEEVKAGVHPRFRFVKDFYNFHNLEKRSFLKYYARFKGSGLDEDILPRRRGPKWKSRRFPEEVESEVLELRKQGMNRYEIASVLKPKLGKLAPSPSGVYKILRRHGVNKLKPKMVEEKRKIIKEKAGELAHIDCHHLGKALVHGEIKRRYLVCVIDSCTRVAWAEVIDDVKSLTVMFAVLRCLNIISERYNIKFQEVITDNGPEFGTKSSSKKNEHPFERMLMELGIKHRYTKPYRPQTNGKAERFWRTLNEDLIEGTDFYSVEEVKDELLQYLVYYNEYRPHQGIGGSTPGDFNKNCPRIT